MTWFFAILIVLAMGGVAVVASGRGGSLAEEYDDRPDVRVPADGPLAGDDVRGVRFSLALRGYRMSEVDALLARLAAQLDDTGSTGAHDPGTTEAGGPADPTARRDGDAVEGTLRGCPPRSSSTSSRRWPRSSWC